MKRDYSTYLGVDVFRDTNGTNPDHLSMTTARYDVKVGHCSEGWGESSVSGGHFMVIQTPVSHSAM